MNTNGKLALTVLACISIGAMSVMAIHAQEAKTPPAYLIAETEIADRDAFQKQRRSRKRWRRSGAASTMSSAAARLRLSRANRQRASW